MDAAITFAEAETKFVSLLESNPLPVTELLALIHSTSVKNNEKDGEWTNLITQELIEAGDFNGLYLVIKSYTPDLIKRMGAEGILNDLKRCCKDRLILAFIDTVPFENQPLEKSFQQLDTLLDITPGAQVIDKTWGFGTVKRLDNFYKRITIDFCGKCGHNLTFKTASETLTRAAHDHLFTVRHNNPDGIARMIKKDQATLVTMAIRSFGKMPIPKLESTLIGHKFLKSSEWKSFWDSARKALKKDPLVVVPSKRTEFIELLEKAASHDSTWFETLESEKDPLVILRSVIELEDSKKIESMDERETEIVNDRLSFAIKGTDNTNPALYVRLIIFCTRQNIKPAVFSEESDKQIDDPHIHLWSKNRFIKAARKLPVKEVSNMVAFLLQEGDDAKEKLLIALPSMPYNLLNETLLALKETGDASLACRKLLLAPKAPPILVNWIFRYRTELPSWNLPPLIDLLYHAIITVETTLNGENLRMQNAIKKLFESSKWLEDIFNELNEAHRQLLFERIQASPAWDPSTHRSLIARMLKLDPALAKRKRSVAPSADSQPRLTSWRSLAEHQRFYKKMVEVDLPKNSKDIAVARSYGDLRENFEYQAAKDYQRQLLQKQAEMQLELELVNGSDFANVSTEQVAEGTTVNLLTEDGVKKSYTILGEWDRDEKLNIISNKTRMAECLLGKKLGDSVLIPIPGGEQKIAITEIMPLSTDITAWIAATSGSTT
ncbi:MAG: GreA/GreB family elongation factor [Kiritimatiellae bacterium]|jgi:transcription elongation GreA/GreB family factor|nr:GreA/GreB family elongation factor [Kiritimatiellia bacterium]